MISAGANEDSLQTFDAHAWHTFRIADLSRLITTMLSEENLRNVRIVWARHYLEYDLVTEIPTILSCIRNTATPGDYIPWLNEDVLPVALPQHHAEILEWYINSINVNSVLKKNLALKGQCYRTFFRAISQRGVVSGHRIMLCEF